MRLLILPVIFGFILIILLDIYIWNDFRKMSIFSFTRPSVKKKVRWDKIFIIFSVLVLVDFITALCLPHRGNAESFQCVIWLLYIFLTVFLSEIVYFIFSALGFIPVLCNLVVRKGKKARRWNTGFWIGLPLAIFTFCAMWYGTIYGRRALKVDRVLIASPRLPESFDGFKIAQLSDLHVGSWGNDTTFISSLVEEVNATEPDLIVFTGDLVNRESSELVPFTDILSRLKAKNGVVSILGNHDYGDYKNWESDRRKQENLAELKKMQKDMGWQLLDNTYLSLKNEAGDSIMIIGVGNWGEPPFHVYGNLYQSYNSSIDPTLNLNDTRFKILLSHNPEHWNREVTKVSNMDLTLSGHTHAMQTMMKIGDWKWSPAQYKYDYWGGHYSRKNKDNSNNNLYVNIGAGEVGFPMRLGANPEITLITLRPEIQNH